MTENNRIAENYDDEINFTTIFSVIWKWKRLIILGTFCATLLSVAISILIPKVYRSEGFFQLGNPSFKFESIIKMDSNSKIQKDIRNIESKRSLGISIPQYKSSSPQFFNPIRLIGRATNEKMFNEDDLSKLTNDLKSTTDVNKWIRPVYAFSKEDAREISQLPKDESNVVLGMNIAYESNSPDNAADHVKFFGNHIRDCLLYVTLYNYVMDGYSNTFAASKKNDNEQIRLQFELMQNTNKKKDFEHILAAYPESSRMESRQVVSVQEGGSRFLPPVTQLVGIESTLAELRRDLAEMERDNEKISIRSEYFSRIYHELSKNGESGEALLRLLKELNHEIFKDKDITRDEVREVFNNLGIDLQEFEFTFLQNTRFISEPTITYQHIKPRKTIIIVVTCVLSFLFFMFLAFIFNWWQRNRKSIYNESSL